MSAPDYVICLNCESPCYNFEWDDNGVTEALCEVCGNDETDQFVTEEDFDTIVGSSDGK